jgi:hypothetical protein
MSELASESSNTALAAQAELSVSEVGA